MTDVGFQNGWTGEVRVSKLTDVELLEICCVPSCGKQGVEMHLYSTDGWVALCREHSDEAWGSPTKPWRQE